MTTAGLLIAGTSVTMEPDLFKEFVRFLIVPAARQSGAAFDNLKPGQESPLIDPMRLQIVAAMQAQSQPVQFDDLESANENIEFRIAAMLVFDAFNSGNYDADYFSEILGIKCAMGWFVDKGQTESPTWSQTAPSDPYCFDFVERKTAPPAQSMAPEIGNIFPFRGECAGAFQLSVYLGLLNGLKAARFNEIARKLNEMYVGSWKIDDVSNPATLFMIKADLADPPIPGDYMYFKNKDDYSHWAPNGFWTGLNAMYMGKDSLGTGHWSGMGAAWLSESNLRSSLNNAYCHDCYPHKVDHPKTEIRFTQRRRLEIPSNFERPAMVQGNQRAERKEISAPLLAGAGLSQVADGLHSGSNLRLGALADSLGFHPQELKQAISAPVDNPHQRVRLADGTLTVTYADPDAARHDPNAVVTAHVLTDSRG